jgi:pyrrolysyl-tRNA synthetase-like protein
LNLASRKKEKQPARRYYRKRVELFRLIEKIKLWPSRRGLLHGIKTTDVIGDQARVTTHCHKTFSITNSRNSRAARWIRNKWFKGVCGVCRVPDWKLAKYSSTHFKRHYGSALEKGSDQKFVEAIREAVDSRPITD